MVFNIEQPAPGAYATVCKSLHLVATGWLHGRWTATANLLKMTASINAIKRARGFSPAKFLETAAKGRVTATYPPGEILYTQGDDADSVFYIRKGKVKITVLSMHGKEAVIALLKADEFFGEGCLIGQPLRLSQRPSARAAGAPCIDKDFPAPMERARSPAVSMDRRRTALGGSSNGRTADSDSANRGSSPRPPAKRFQ